MCRCRACLRGRSGERLCRLHDVSHWFRARTVPYHRTTTGQDMTWHDVEKEGDKDAQVPTGTLMEISVPTSALPLAGTVTSFALYRSCPAAYALPLVGALALSLSKRTCSCCSALVAAAAATDGAMGAGGWRADMLAALANGVGVAVPESSPRGSVEACVRGDGSMTFVRLGSGELGRDGGSWVTGVAAESADIVGCFGVFGIGSVRIDIEAEGGEGRVKVRVETTRARRVLSGVESSRVGCDATRRVCNQSLYR